MKTFLSLALNSSLPSCSAAISGAASGLPLAATAFTASTVSLNSSVVKPGSASS